MLTERFDREDALLFFKKVALYRTAFPELSLDRIVQHIADGDRTLHRGLDRIDDRQRVLWKRRHPVR